MSNWRDESRHMVDSWCHYLDQELTAAFQQINAAQIKCYKLGLHKEIDELALNLIALHKAMKEVHKENNKRPE